MKYLCQLLLAGLLLVAWPIRSQRAPAELRVITYNLRSGQGYGESDEQTRRERFSLIGRTMRQYRPDVLVIQEPGSDPNDYAALVEALGSNYRHRVLKCPDYAESKRVGLLVYRTPVVIDSIDVCIQGEPANANTLFNHWARVSLNFRGTTLVVYGFKLAPREQADKRRRQIDLLEPYLRQDLAQQRSIIVAGDLNHLPSAPEYQRWKRMGLVDTYDAQAQGNGFTKMDELGDDPLVPYRRIDYLLVSPNLATHLVGSSRTLSEGVLVPAPPRRRWSLSDHLPVLAVFALPE